MTQSADAQDNRRGGFQIPDDATSADNSMLARILERFPDADTNEDGVLDAKEGRAFFERQRERQRERWRQRGNQRRGRLLPTLDNVKYGPDDKHHFDLYRAQTDSPAPLVIFFHGGQFITGEERDTRGFDFNALLQAGISVASIDYRDANIAPFPGPFEDAQLALQFIRFYAEQLHIDPTRIAALGDEAGGNLGLYLALHDDLADPKLERDLKAGRLDDPRELIPGGLVELSRAGSLIFPDPTAEEPEPETPEAGEEAEEDAPPSEPAERDRAEVEPITIDDLILEEILPWNTPAIEAMPTRLTATAARHPIATFDPRAWPKLELPMNGHERMMTKYLAVRYLEPINDPVVIEIVEAVSPLALVSADDPPLLLLSQYTDEPMADNTQWTIARHHPKQSQLIAEAMRDKGNQAIVRHRGMDNDPGMSSVEFLIEMLK